MRDLQPGTARRLWKRLEPLHAVTYFSAEPLGALGHAGYKGFWMGYFAGRGAPLGPVGADPVLATFYNFDRDRVAKALPDAWGFAPPAAALDARLAGSTATLRRVLVDLPPPAALDRLVAILRQAAESAPVDGRALFAANRSLDWPDDPVAALWHAATLLREHRGDGHVAVLVAEGVSGRESNVLQSSVGGLPRQVLVAARDYTDDEWAALVAALDERGLVEADGTPTAAGRALKDHIEARTDALAWSAYESLDDHQLQEAAELLGPLARQVLASGEVPVVGPIGDLAEDP